MYLTPYYPFYLAVLIFVALFGAIVGSFLNVVIYRLPAGRNIVSPPSRCPQCGRNLRWHENLPVVGWFRLGGRCAGCGVRISPQYWLIELLCASLFAGVFILYYVVHPEAPVVGGIGPESFARLGLGQTWPMLVLHLGLIASLLAMTIIDARTYTIPIQITWFLTGLAVAAHAVTVLFLAEVGEFTTPQRITLMSMSDPIDLTAWTIPLIPPIAFNAAAGACVGLCVSLYLRHCNVLRHSFLDFNLFVKEEDSIISYPGARREMEWEIGFLVPMILGAIAATRLPTFPLDQYPDVCQVLGSVAMGYLVGGGLIWGARLLGTYAFGKEAMGYGDVHILAAVGACLGWIDPISIFFLAPFMALVSMIVISLASRLSRSAPPYVPYGPWLALATLFVLLADPLIEPFLSLMLGGPVNLP